VIWDRNSKTFVGGGQPLVYTVSADATAQANLMSNASNRHDKQPKPVFDVVTVTVS
jgi:hypothetical protein